MTEVYSREQAAKELNRLVEAAEEALSAAEAFASKHELEFRFSPSYGMGGTYYGKFNDAERSYYGRTSDCGWIASSETC